MRLGSRFEKNTLQHIGKEIQRKNEELSLL